MAESQPLVSKPVVASDDKQALPRSWRFPLWRIAGDGSSEDVVAGCLALQAPAVAYGWNLQRALQLPFWRVLAKFVLLLGGSYLLLSFAAHALVFSCAGWPKPPSDDDDAAPGEDGPHYHHHLHHRHHPCLSDLPAECRPRVFGGLAVLALLALVVVGRAVYCAARRRQQMREQFGIDGTFKRDMLAWLFCSVCALAQETRTLMAAQVHDGVWYGPMVNNHYSVPATQQMA